jgi:DNA-binding response OmpR family regulator
MSTVEHNRRILIVDPDATISMTLEPYFKEQGFQAMVVPSGTAALSEVLGHPPSLILLAARLPDSTGLDIFRQLRSRVRTAHIPVMFLAEHKDADQQKDLLAAGADDFITKPFDIDILGLRVRNAIKRAERDGVTHPHTGLPTGRLIQERIRALADELGWYKIDFSIENFNAFRDNYGFMTSEEVITFAAHLLNEVVQSDGAADDFMGHRDDTDFVVITKLANGPALKAALEKRFNDEALSFYSFMEREQGYIEVIDGNGGKVQKPLMSAKIKVQEGEPEE